MRKQRKISQIAYETLHMAVESMGGIGGGRYTDDKSAPLCALGFDHEGMFDEAYKEIRTAISDLGSPWSGVAAANDDAVTAINFRNGNPSLNQRVSFEDYVAELNIVPDPALDAQYGP